MLETFTTIMGIAMSFGYYPQAYKIYKNKSVKNISVSTYVVFAIGTLTWTIYGFYKNDITIILGFLVGVVGSWLVLSLIWYYRNNG